METHMIFETHAHYDDEAFEQDREALLLSLIHISEPTRP